MFVAGKPHHTVFIILIIFLLFSCGKTKGRGGAAPQDKAPDFTLSDMSGKKVRLSELSGKVVLLEFWATWCFPCRESIPGMNTLYKKYKDRGFILLGLSVDKGKEEIASFMKENPVGYPVLHDDADVNVRYGVYSIPTIVIIDRKGRVAAKYAGFNPYLEEKLSKEIEALL